MAEDKKNEAGQPDNNQPPPAEAHGQGAPVENKPEKRVLKWLTVLTPLLLVIVLVLIYGLMIRTFVTNVIDENLISENVKVEKVNELKNKIEVNNASLYGTDNYPSPDSKDKNPPASNGVDKKTTNCYPPTPVDPTPTPGANPVATPRVEDINPISHDIEKGGYKKCIEELNRQIGGLEQKISEKDVALKRLRFIDCFNNSPANSTDSSKCEGANPVNETAVTRDTRDDKSKLDQQLSQLKARRDLLVQERDNYRNELLSYRSQLGSRYSKRMVWVFLSALIAALCLICVVLTTVIAYRCFYETQNGVMFGLTPPKGVKTEAFNTLIWFVVTFIAASIAVFVIGLSDYLKIVEEMIKKTVVQGEDVPLEIISISILMIFFACVFLVSATCTVLYAVTETEESLTKERKDLLVAELSAKALKEGSTVEERAKLAELEKTNTKEPQEKLDEYSSYMRSLKIVLYIGTLMLLIGMVRSYALTDWHLAFVSTEQDGSFAKVLDGFSKFSQAVQGGFYTLLLAVVYLPAVFLIRNKARDQMGKLPTPPVDKDDALEKQGFIFSYAEIVPRFLLIIAPLLVGSFGDPLSKFIGSITGG